MSRSIILDWILIYRNWSFGSYVSHLLEYHHQNQLFHQKGQDLQLVLGLWLIILRKETLLFYSKTFSTDFTRVSKTNWFCIIMLHYWPKILAPLFHPITSETKTSLYLVPHAFPRFASAACVYFEFWLVPWIVCVLCDWPEWLLWFWFYDNWNLLYCVTINNNLQQN